MIVEVKHMRYKIFIAAIFTLFSCNKRDEEISYPASLENMRNVLSVGPVVENVDYSFGAQLGRRAELKIVITNLSVQTNVNQPKPVWFYAGTNSWDASDYSNDMQTFTASKTGTINQDITFSGHPGACKIEYYENSKSITRSQYINW